jgi:hypothetical protein
MSETKTVLIVSRESSNFPKVGCAQAVRLSSSLITANADDHAIDCSVLTRLHFSSQARLRGNSTLSNVIRAREIEQLFQPPKKGKVGSFPGMLAAARLRVL